MKNWLDGRAQRALVSGVQPSWCLLPRAQYWGPFYLVFLSMFWMRGSSTPSLNSQVRPSWVAASICLRVGGLCEGPGQTVPMGHVQSRDVQQGQVPGPTPGSQQPHVVVRAWGRVAGKLPGRKGLGGAGQQAAKQEPAVGPGVSKTSGILACIRNNTASRTGEGTAPSCNPFPSGEGRWGRNPSQRGKGLRDVVC